MTKPADAPELFPAEAQDDAPEGTPENDEELRAAEMRAMARECRYDPNAWADYAWADSVWDRGEGELAGAPGPRSWQREINQMIADHLQNPASRYHPLRLSVASGHGIGKSAQMGMLANWAMSCHPGCKIVMTANTEKQLATKTSPEIAKWFGASLTADWFNISALSIKAKDKTAHAFAQDKGAKENGAKENGAAGDRAPNKAPNKATSSNWRMDFVAWSEHNTEAFAGLHNKGRIILLMMDEASNIADKIWEVAEGALTDEGTIIIWVAFGNPTRNVGRFREAFRKYRNYWLTRQIDSRQVEGTNKTYLDSIIEQYGENSDIAKVRVRGMFPAASSKQFISTADVDAAASRHLRPEQYKHAPVILGVDPAWTGEDEFVIYLRQGLYSELIATWARNDNDVEMAQRILDFETRLNADAVFIDQGHGTGLYSMGKTWGRSWQLVNFAGESLDPGCLNKRAQIWKDLRDWLKEGGAIDPKDDVLYQDLIGPELKPRLDGKIQLESKNDMKKRDIPSPNRADALALTFAFRVAPRMGVGGAEEGKAVIDYDPFG